MRSTVNNEILFTWVLFLANECSVDAPRRSYDKHYFGFTTNLSPRNSNHRPKNFHREDSNMMTCNCSWGTTPEGLGISLKRLKYKIVGGTHVEDSENYPMMAGLQWKKEHCVFCGATILTQFHALTAAHCLNEENTANIILAVGIHHRCKEPDDGGQYLPLVEPAYIHEYYDKESNNQDIAIVVTQRSIIFSNNVGPTCIHTQPLEPTVGPLLILGWGKTSEEEEPSRDLLKVFLNQYDKTQCRLKMPPGFINDNANLQLCTYALNKDSCGGDSGGPLFILDRSMNRLVQVALVSMGIGCARVDEPGINTALFPYLGWMQWTIERTTRIHHPQISRCTF